MSVTGNSIPDESKQKNLPMIEALRGNKVSNTKLFSLGYLNINSIRNKLSRDSWLFEINLDVFAIEETKLDSSFPESLFFLEGMRKCPSKHLFRLTRVEDVLKTSWRRLQRSISQEIFKMCLQNFFLKMYLLRRRLEFFFGRRLAKTSWRHLENVLETSWKMKIVRLHTFLRRLQDVSENKEYLLGLISRLCQKK